MRIILCGFGAVGQSLASLFESRAKELYEMHGLRPRIVGVFDSKGAAFQSSGLDPGKLVSVKKSKGVQLEQYVRMPKLESCTFYGLDHDEKLGQPV